MKFSRGISFILLLSLLSITTLIAQDEDSGGSLTIEELYLSQEIEIQIVRSQALSPERETKLLAIQTLRSMADEGTLNENSQAMLTILESLAGEGVTRIVRQGNTVINDYPEVRRQAAELLGEIGGEFAVQTLIRMAEDDPEPMVLSQAVYALGQIGSNENNEVSSRIARILRRNSAQVVPDNNLAFACLLSIEKLNRGNDGIVDPSLLEALLEVVTGNYITTVVQKAAAVIQGLRSRN